MRHKEETIKSMVNKIGKNSNPSFYYIKSFFPIINKKKSYQRVCVVKSIKTGEIKESKLSNLSQNKNPFNRKSDCEIILEVSKIGKKHNPPFFVNQKKSIIRGKNLKVRITNAINNEEITAFVARLLKSKKVCFPRYEQELENTKLKSLCQKNNVVFCSLYKNYKNEHDYVLIKDPYSNEKKITKKETILNDKFKNPFKYTKKTIKKIVQDLKTGKNTKIKYKKHFRENRRLFVLVEVKTKNGKINKLFNFYSLLKTKNISHMKNDDQVRNEINKIGKKANPQFICVNPNSRKNQHGTRYVIVKNKKTQKTYETTYRHLTKFKFNPFNTNQNREEIQKIHPIYKKLFTKLGFQKIPFKFNNKNIIDFMIKHPKMNKNIVIEVKQSNKFHKYSIKQKKRYIELSKNKKYNIEKIYFSDPEGRHQKYGFISIKELEKQLKKIIKNK